MGSICSRTKTGAFQVLPGCQLMLHFCNRSQKTKDTLFAVIVIILLIQSFTISTRAAMPGSRYICDKIPGLTPRQRSICHRNPSATILADEGSFMGLEECQRQFKHSRWNCGSNEDASAMTSDERIGTKEAAFHSAVRAAGVLHAIAKACTQGQVRNCGCDSSKRDYFTRADYRKWRVDKTDNRDNRPSLWEWGGCSVSIRQANRLCREVWDSREMSRNLRARINLHNYVAGRKALMKKLRIRCKCHGKSASCTLKTCWVTLPDFREVGNALRVAYAKSTKVRSISGRRSRNQYPIIGYYKNGIPTKPLKRDLVYTDDSPSYCVFNETTRTAGTEGRVCWMTSDRDYCSHLCCGRGHKPERIERKWDCKCKFYWCCRVECDECSEKAEQYTCH